MDRVWGGGTGFDTSPCRREESISRLHYVLVHYFVAPLRSCSLPRCYWRFFQTVQYKSVFPESGTGLSGSEDQFQIPEAICRKLQKHSKDVAESFQSSECFVAESFQSSVEIKQSNGMTGWFVAFKSCYRKYGVW